MKSIILALTAISVLTFSGCAGSNPAPGKKQVQAESSYKVGKATKSEVITDLGTPSGRSYNSKGEETLVYRNIHQTGKAWIPFYFGHDRVRTSVKLFTFNAKNILTKYSTSSNHY